MFRYVFHLRVRAILLAPILVFPVLSLLALQTFRATPYLYPKKASGRMTTASQQVSLRGEAALTHLKEQGLYSSLGQAVKAARYDAQPLPSGKAFEFFNPE